ncbi:bucentaur or craniofacial development-domain-containing protein [Lipomyces tetrasporus]|uniref:SWR1-complex protein 5 n=1 Tax=Lipomyces tetrasporus TaxID=54092 RepID=A0AAD7QPD9_9ASCO|nr:bucentaur or craniofacial development-domain-containing protein [Lipomyces tetrasporus]KAJ8097397.1 bucentaur or craniofacial development-domain-containing protein [Lipomyces tetrasporus]
MPDEQQKVDFPEEEEYRESEDEDFDPHAAADDNVLSSDDDADDAHGNEDIDEGISRKRNAERGHKSKDKESKDEEQDEAGEGIRVLTRSQRIAEEAREKSAALSRSKTTIDADAVWASLREASKSEASARLAERSNTTAEKEEDMITITETYEFAKNIITKEKKVPRNSTEGQAYLKKQAEREEAEHSSVASSAAESSVTPSGSSTQQSATKSKLGGGPRKRKGSSLEAIAAQGKPKKLNTLEKSKLDWQGFVQEEGIEDDIRRHNKGGYLHKQDFLSRVEEKRYADLKEGQKIKRP